MLGTTKKQQNKENQGEDKMPSLEEDDDWDDVEIEDGDEESEEEKNWIKKQQ